MFTKLGMDGHYEKMILRFVKMKLILHGEWLKEGEGVAKRGKLS
jgi:hypothetical protein